MSELIVGILGLGVMGSGIAELVVRSGHEVVAVDVDQRVVQTAVQRITRSLQKAVDKGRLTVAQMEEAQSRLKTKTGIDAFGTADIVIESVPEQLELKQSIYRDLDRICKPEAILTTNTSSLSITTISEATGRPDRVIGLHFINPPQAIPLVEIIPGARTSPETLSAVQVFARSLGKDFVVAKDSPAFALNRMVAPLLNEAFCLLDEGVATPEDIDKAMVVGARHPMGPLALADMAGLDTILAIMQTLERETGKPKYRSARRLQELVSQGHLGVKTGRGVYVYNSR
jgi:3-hydroxybutyryl-CoA dehydrogenase